MEYRLTDDAFVRALIDGRALPLKETDVSNDFYIPEEDVIGTKPETGVQYIIAVKGMAIPRERARELGILKDQPVEVGPTETKIAQGGTEQKDGTPVQDGTPVHSDDADTDRDDDATPPPPGASKTKKSGEK